MRKETERRREEKKMRNAVFPAPRLRILTPSRSNFREEIRGCVVVRKIISKRRQGKFLGKITEWGKTEPPRRRAAARDALHLTRTMPLLFCASTWKLVVPLPPSLPPDPCHVIRACRPQSCRARSIARRIAKRDCECRMQNANARLSLRPLSMSRDEAPRRIVDEELWKLM